MRPGQGQKGDFFGSFLNEMSSAQTAGTAAPDENVAAEPRILQVLAGFKEATSVRELLGRVDLPPSLLITALHKLSEAGLVELTRNDTDECAVLTDLGRRVAH